MHQNWKLIPPERKAGYERLDEFDNLLLKVVDKTLRYVLGDRNTSIIYDYLEHSSCPIHEIPGRLDLFSEKLRDLVGTSRGQMLGAPTILEDAIVTGLASELGLKPENESNVFEERIRRLKERCNKKTKRAFPEHSNRAMGHDTALLTAPSKETRRITMNKTKKNHILSRLEQESILPFAQEIWRDQHSTVAKIVSEALNIIRKTYKANPAFFRGKSAKGILGGLFYLLGHRFRRIKTQKKIARSLNTTDMTIRASYRKWLKEFPGLFQDVNEQIGRTRESGSFSSLDVGFIQSDCERKQRKRG